MDFVCLEKRLIIEVDGGQHASDKSDIVRDRWLKKEGFAVLRFWNTEVLSNLEGVLEAIRDFVLSHPPPAPPLIKGGEL